MPDPDALPADDPAPIARQPAWGLARRRRKRPGRARGIEVMVHEPRLYPALRHSASVSVRDMPVAARTAPSKPRQAAETPLHSSRRYDAFMAVPVTAQTRGH